MTNLSAPIIYKTEYNLHTANRLNDQIKTKYGSSSNQSTLLIDYPTVYIIENSTKTKHSQYTVYVGETNDIQRRTLQHLDRDPMNREDFSDFKNSNNVTMYVIGHSHFNKSMTLDIENRLMQYLSSVNSVERLNNRRHNDQNRYYDYKEFDELFNKIWKKLNHYNSSLFPVQRIVESSALFKAFPFNKLTTEQLNAKSEIIEKINIALFDQKRQTQNKGQLILVEGEAGSGKTVLMSNIFYDLIHEDQIMRKDMNLDRKPLSVSLLVNQKEQLKVYKEIARKLFDKEDNISVEKPVTFIKKTDPNKKIDIALVDEAHLLLTQASQSYSNDKRHPEVQVGTNMLEDILKRAKIVMAVFDPKQILSTDTVWTEEQLKNLKAQAGKQNIISLNKQMRIDANPQTIEWIRNFIDKGIVGKIPADDNYQIRIFDDPAKMQKAIEEKNANQDKGISRMVATFDWEYSGGARALPKDQDYWEVSENNWKMPWNYEINRREKYERKNQKHNLVKYNQQSWAEKDYTINEIGSTYTVQGFDLNYVGVELGPSVKFKDGHVIRDPKYSKNNRATRKRDSNKSYAGKLLSNELNVLMTRGVHGLYLHAVDPELQKALEDAVNR